MLKFSFWQYMFYRPKKQTVCFFKNGFLVFPMSVLFSSKKHANEVLDCFVLWGVKNMRAVLSSFEYLRFCSKKKSHFGRLCEISEVFAELRVLGAPRPDLPRVWVVRMGCAHPFWGSECASFSLPVRQSCWGWCSFPSSSVGMEWCVSAKEVE